MATITEKSALKGASGKLGNIVTYDLNGTQVVRTRPSTRKKRKLTELQENHRFAFREMHRFTKAIKRQIIDRIWIHQPVTGGLNAYNLFIKTNRAAFGHGENITFPELLLLSKGDLEPAKDFSVRRQEDTVLFTWEAGYTGKHARSSDRLNIVVLASDRYELVISDIQTKRGEGTASIPVNGNLEVMEGYAFWSSENDLSFSPSVFWRV
jgi:hypothetical protein